MNKKLAELEFQRLLENFENTAYNAEWEKNEGWSEERERIAKEKYDYAKYEINSFFERVLGEITP